MSESINVTGTGELRNLRALLAFRRVPSAANGHDEAVELSAPLAAEADDDRMMVLARLGEKSRKLHQSEGVLQGLYDSSTDPQERRELDLQIDESWAERQLCDSRFRAIAANGPFSNPGPQADSELLDAINSVDAAIRNTAAVQALLQAVSGLVRAFPARST